MGRVLTYDINTTCIVGDGVMDAHAAKKYDLSEH